MDKIRFGKTELMLTKIGFGGIPVQRLSKEDGIRLVKYALDSGINWIDTANAYGISEEIVGKAVEGYDRSKIYIFTKSLARDKDLLKAHIDNSLEKLKTPYIDLFQLHSVSDAESWNKIEQNGIIAYLEELQKAGVIKHIGLSSHNKEIILRIMEHDSIEAVQFPFNFVMEDHSLDIVKKAARLDQGFIAMKPFGGGVFEDASACISFFNQYPHIVLDPGFEKISEVKEVIEFAERNIKLSRAEKKHIRLVRQRIGTRFCRRCGYCEPCENGVSIVTIMNIESFMKRFPLNRLTDEGWFAKDVDTYENCTQCGICQTKCPYKLPIMSRMKENIAAYKKIMPALQ